jgi:alcohol dehydrogenase (cytochrome c)
MHDLAGRSTPTGADSKESAFFAHPTAVIDEGVLRGHIRFLADDLLEGRGPGTRGDELTQLYMATQFQTLGLQPAAPDGSWLQWRRTHDASGHSPLAQINRDNVASLGVAWSLALPPGPNAATPLVHDGVMFVHAFGDRVLALDARTGDVLWRYERDLPGGVAPSVKRNLSVYGGLVYAGTSDAHVVALDMQTGEVVWDAQVGNVGDGHRLTGGPLVARGVVMQGTVGGMPGGPHISGLDAATGEELWRFHTIARPGEPGGETWNDLPLEQRNGGSVWTAGYFDPENGLAFFGPAPTYDTGPLRDPVAVEGVGNEALYTNATVALDVHTGELVWHFQHLPNDQWDLDWSFERQVIEMEHNGESRRLVLTGGKHAVFDAVDAATGAYAFSLDMGIQNLVLEVDPETGDKIIDEALIPGDGETKTVCPHAGGGKSWPPAAYDPATGLLYVQMAETCMDLTPVPEGERGNLSTGVRWSLQPPEASDGLYGRLQAVDVVTGETLWTVRERYVHTTGLLSTGGGLVFAGSLDRRFGAYDGQTGERLWETRLSDVPGAAPITYAVDGRQYLAMVVGHGSAHAATFPPLYPELAMPPTRSASVWVFALPE